MAQIVTHPSNPHHPGHVTTNRSTSADLKASLIARGGAVGMGLTFGDFIDACRRLGIKDSDALSSIEIGISQFGGGYITRDPDADGVEIREV